MIKLKIIPLLLVFSQLLFSQPREFSKLDREKNVTFNEKIFYSYWLNPVQFDENLILNYNIRYDFLLFEKVQNSKSASDTFQARIKVMLELESPDLFIPIRNIEEVTIKTKDFEQTISKKFFYTSNFSIKVPAKKYKATLTIIDQVRNKEFNFKPFEIDLEDTTNFQTIFIKESDYKLLFSQELRNRFHNFLPFSSEKYLLILPDKEFFNEITIKDNFVKYDLKRKENVGLRYSIYNIDTLDLIEGVYDLIWKGTNKNFKKFSVLWIDKPEYLKTLDLAIKIMGYLFEDKELLNKNFIDKAEQNRKFFELWKKYDPTPQTPFNELMAEFYNRADYASVQFKTVSEPDGAQTDRGKIFIIYGYPATIERSFLKDGRSVEVWTYNTNKNLKFTFVDENKNGNFRLQK